MFPNEVVAGIKKNSQPGELAIRCVRFRVDQFSIFWAFCQATQEVQVRFVLLLDFGPLWYMSSGLPRGFPEEQRRRGTKSHTRDFLLVLGFFLRHPLF